MCDIDQILARLVAKKEWRPRSVGASWVFEKRYSMLQAIHPSFSHLAKPHGMTYSYCRECMTIIAVGHWEVELEVAEGNHICDPVRLEYVRSAVGKGKRDVTHLSSARLTTCEHGR